MKIRTILQNFRSVVFLILLPLLIKNVDSKFSIDECGKSKGCLFKPDNCVPYENCAYVFTYSADANTIYMELFGQVLGAQNTFLAVGFSHDHEMGNDTVTDCSSFTGSPFVGRLSYNPGKSNLRVPLNQATQNSILKTISTEYQNGTLYCQLAQQIDPPSNVLPMFVAPLDSFYYILMASGRTTSLYSHPELSVHTLNESSVLFPFVSQFPVDLQRFKRATNMANSDVNSGNTQTNFNVVDTSTPNTNSQFDSSSQNDLTQMNLPQSDDRVDLYTLNQNASYPLGIQPQHQYPQNKQQQQTPFVQNQFQTQSPSNTNFGGQVQQNPSVSPTNGQSQQTGQQQQPTVDTSGVLIRDVVTEAKLMTAHGICMVLALVFFLSNGILWASQYRLVWPKVEPFGLQLWFHIHRTLNLIAVILFICGFVVVFTAKDWRWVGPKAYATVAQNQEWGSIHAILGILTCCVVVAQVLLAVLRCHPNSSFRIIFRLLHGFLGYGAWLMGAAAIMIAVVHFPTMFLSQPAAMGLFIAFVAVSGIVIILLTLMSMIRWCRIRRSTVSHEIEMKEINGKQETTIIPPEIQRDRGLRIVILVFYLIVSVGIAVAISALIGVRHT